MKIVSVGCSFTSGVGVLEKETYTYQLAKLLNCDFTNWGEAGHSNQYIFRKTIEVLKNWNPNDILIIQWTNPNREEIVTNEGYLFYPPWSDWVSLSFLYGKNPIEGLRNIGVFDKDEFEKKVVEKKQKFVDSYCENFYNEDYLLNLSFCFQYSLYGLLEKLNVKYLMFFGWEIGGNTYTVKNFEKYKTQKQIFDFTNEKFLKENFGSFTNTPESEHPDANGHNKWANYLYEKVKELNYI